MGVIVYSCKTQQANPGTTMPTVSTNPSETTAVLTKEEILQKGELTYNMRCGKCHDLPTPSEFTIADWQPIIKRMAPKAKLNADETNWVLAYVNANAKK